MRSSVDGSLAIAWQGIPSYAARCIRAVARGGRVFVRVLATEGPHAKSTIESALGQPITWLQEGGWATWDSLAATVPSVFCYSGWSNAQFNRLAAQARRAGAKVICMVDNIPKRSLRQFVGRFVFRFTLLPHIDAVLVPGESGRQLMRSFGVPEDRIHTGLYGADPTVFVLGPALSERPVDFLFVGQFIRRKGIKHLAGAVSRLKGERRSIHVVAIGQGPLEDRLKAAGIEVLPFAPPEIVADYMRRSKFLVLPSIEDHWGVVVHEAALSGCGLLLSSGVGSHHDLLSSANGCLCAPNSTRSLLAALEEALGKSGAWLAGCPPASLQLASAFGPKRFARSFHAMVEQLLTSPRDAEPRPGASLAAPA